MWYGPWIPSSTLSYYNFLKQRLGLYSQEPTVRCPKPVAKVTREAEIEPYLPIVFQGAHVALVDPHWGLIGHPAY